MILLLIVNHSQEVIIKLFHFNPSKAQEVNIIIILTLKKNIYYIYINLLVSGLHKIHIISNTVFHAARNLQGEGVDVAVDRIVQLILYIYIY